MTTKKKIEDIVEAQADSVPSVKLAKGDDKPTIINVVVAREGDSYASLAEKYAPEGARKHEYAVALFELNGGAVVRPGAKILVK